MTHQDATGQRPAPPPAAGLRAPMGAGRVPGPRQEYIDAFDDRNYGRVPEPRGGAATGRPGEEPRPAAHPAAGRSGGGAATGQHPVVDPTLVDREDTEPAPRPRGRSGGGRRRAPKKSRRERREAGERGGWGRTLTGVASAAVVTVLAVVVAAQIALPDEDGREGLNELAGPDDADRRDGPDDEDRDADGDGPGTDLGGDPSPPAEPTYQELLATTVAMDPELTGSGELVPVGGSDPAPDPDAATVVRYRVDVERDIGIDPEFFAEVVHRTLNDDRSWSNGGERSFARVSDGDYDFVVTLASPGTTADWCDRSGLDVREQNVSCDSSFTERVMINGWRWAQGSETYGDDIAGYRQMLVNHEVGHRLGFGHAVCPADGALAPVMMQQTKFLTLDGLTCEPNPWPHPEN